MVISKTQKYINVRTVYVPCENVQRYHCCTIIQMKKSDFTVGGLKLTIDHLSYPCSNKFKTRELKGI